MKRIKVLHLLATDRFSGAENVVCQIIKMYKTDSHIQMVYCSPDGDIKDYLFSNKIAFLPLKKLSYNNLKKAIKEYKPDIIHAHDIKASILASLFSKNIRVISHIHGNSIEMRKFTAKSILYNWSSKKISHIFWVSKSSLDDYKFKNSVVIKSTVLPNIIDCKDILKSVTGSKKEWDIIFVGRIIKLKNPERLLKIVSGVIEKRPTTKVAIVGTGDLESDLKESIINRKLEKNIKMLGFQKNPYKYMASSKIMILTSIYEGTPMAVLEAMSLGLPVVSTPIDGMKDLITNNVDGYLSDNDEELVNNIVEILNNDDKYKILSENVLMKSKSINDIKKYKNELIKKYK